MAHLQRIFRVDLSITDSIAIRGVRYILVESDETRHVLREEKSGSQVVVRHREFAELLADGEATIDIDAFVLWQDILLLPPVGGWETLSATWPNADG